MNGTTEDRRIDADAALRSAILHSRLLVGSLAGTLLLAGTVVSIGGAVVAPGDVTVEGRVKTVTHPSGGVLSSLLVHDGQRVRKGEALMRLDDSVTSVGQRSSGEDLDSLVARRARLRAERDGSGVYVVPEELEGRSDPSALAAIARERRQLQLDAASRTGQRTQLRERIAAAEEQISGLRQQGASAVRQRQIIEPERAAMKDLWDKRLVSISRYNQMERTAVELDSSKADMDSRAAATRSQVAELRQSMLSVDDDARTRAGAELAEVESRLADARTRSASASDAQRRALVVAPADGIVDAIAFPTVGSAVPAGQALLRIVPDREAPVVEVRLSPTDIDQVHVGQRVDLVFSAFNQRTTPKIEGTLEWISADRSVDERTGAAHYPARVAVTKSQVRRLGMPLRSGMPVEAYVATGERSLLSYIVKPLMDQFKRAFRED